eukprot:CAMPEP_0176424322 /NCGR_PEP_ID=MMETSP0127-20121128/10776_1 /TAXON_ID=938130 /ORGANISM="Platyophrya macrostoma, Strain WH" /LENGTH=835 /DNA_ID=CAMNT_0017805373 /DNA_START=22 /DNA_END=2529 /DNA_ORIENTATION=-
MTYYFSDLDKRALIGYLLLELFHADKKTEIKRGEGFPIETLVVKEKGEERVLSGFYTILNYLVNKKLQADDVNLLWKVSYQLTFMEVIQSGKKKTTKVKVRNEFLGEIEQILTKTAFLTGKAMSHIDIVAYVNTYEIVEKALEEYTKSYPKFVKYIKTIGEQVGKHIQKANELYPKVKKEEVKEENKKEEEKKADGGAKKKGGKDSKVPDAKHVIPGAGEYVPPERPKGGDKVVIEAKYQELLNAQKIKRLSTGTLLPVDNKKNVLITSALPYVNNVPHLGNIIGCVLSADVFARFSRLRGNNTIYICGTDEYGTATENKALQEGVTPKELCDKYFVVHKEVYEWFDCDFDYFGRTTTEQQKVIAQDIFLSLHRNGLLVPDVLEQPFCATCNRFLSDRFIQGKCPHCGYEDARGDQCEGTTCGKLLDAADLINPKCEICRNPPEIRKTKHLFLDLPTLTERLDKWVKKSSDEGMWTSNSKQVTHGWIKQGLKNRCVTRDLKWGVPVPLEEYKDKVFYVWFDAPIGYISITANYTPDWSKWWKNPDNVSLYQFMGKDNIPFHTVIFPSTLIGTSEPWTLLNNISTTEYLNYEAGLKFSKSKGTGVFGDGAKSSGVPSEVWRYYLLANRPESSDSEFSWNDFAAKVNNELLSNPGNLANRALKFAYDRFGKKIPTPDDSLIQPRDLEFLENFLKHFKEFVAIMDKVEIKNGLKHAMEISTMANKYMQDEKPWDEANKENKRSDITIFILANIIRIVSAIFEPFMPSFSAKVNYFLNLSERTERDDKIFEYLLNVTNVKDLLTFVPKGHSLNAPVPLFKKVYLEDINEFRAKFGGKKE